VRHGAVAEQRDEPRIVLAPQRLGALERAGQRGDGLLRIPGGEPQAAARVLDLDAA
jgi:hypothetical protein